MDADKIHRAMAVLVFLITEDLTDIELAALNNVAQCDFDPHGRVFDYEKVKDLFSERDGTRMHEEVKQALATVVMRRLGQSGS